jgi:ATP-dependent Lon protease
MYKLPYITIPSEILIPHPSNSFTITLNSTKNELLTTSNIVFENTNYEDAFITIAAKTNKEFSKFATLCVLDAKVEDQENQNFVYHFSTCKKVIILDASEKELTFKAIPFRKTPLDEIENYLSVINFIKNNIYLHDIKNNVDLLNDNYIEVLDQIINYLYPTHKQDYSFYDTDSFIKKLSIINLLIIKYETDFIEKTQNKKYPKYVFERIHTEKQRLNMIPTSSNEYSSTLDYLDVVQSLPWVKTSESLINIEQIEDKLNSSHHGLQEVKETIVDHFAFEQLTEKSSGVMLLFDGPPGTGKTSIAKAIASATNRNFISISLGGLNDEAEIRGHRRTYIGSRPGRFISALKKLPSNNPVILLDEIDKIVSSSSKGNPQAALLEILDPEQNSEFIDRYLEIPFNFNNALFICTSNHINNISKPLLDRLEVIKFRDYTVDEKYNILTQYIIPNLLQKYNLETYNIIFTEEFLNFIIKNNNLRSIKKIILRILKNSSRKILKGFQKIVVDLELYNLLYKNEKEKKRIGF